MFRIALFFLGFALFAAFLGWGGVENFSFEGARTLFAVCLVVAVLSFAAGWFHNRPTRGDG